jgi:hypothetical protein
MRGRVELVYVRLSVGGKQIGARHRRVEPACAYGQPGSRFLRFFLRKRECARQLVCKLARALVAFLRVEGERLENHLLRG